MKEYLDLLGLKATDRVTGFKGVVTTVGFDLYGCVQAIVQPPASDKGEAQESRWLDVNRLEVTSQERVMPLPTFGAVDTLAGPADKPAQQSKPTR